MVISASIGVTYMVFVLYAICLYICIFTYICYVSLNCILTTVNIVIISACVGVLL